MTSDVQYRKILKLGLGKYIDGIVTSEEAGEENRIENFLISVLKKQE